MGKGEEESNLPSVVVLTALEDQQNVKSSFCCCCVWSWVSMRIGVRCLILLVFSVAVFLSALFWLPPFVDQGDLDLDSRFKDHVIVASFNLETPASLLNDNILQLENDIFDEIGYPNTKVVVLSLVPSAGSNITKVIFGIDPEAKYSKISSTAQSLIKASFASLVIGQTSLRLTASLFAEPFFFEVLKFPGGITVIPPQSAFLLQRVQIRFNFTLNFSIYQIQVNFDELVSQLKSGLQLAPYENVYIRLSNSKGSTIAPPTTVQSSVLLTVGNTPRLKQLAQTITASHSGNLGLNNTVFGKVKQVTLSSILQHSLHGGEGSATSWSPTPSPLPHPRLNAHHHQHHHHHHHNADLAPSIAPTPTTKKDSHATTKDAPAPAPVDFSPARGERSPAPERGHNARPPGCQGRNRRSPTEKTRKQPNVSPTVAPHPSPHYYDASPRQHTHPPALSPAPNSRSSPVPSPLPNVVFPRAKPPGRSESDKQHSNIISPISPSPTSSSADCPTARWATLLTFAVILHSGYIYVLL